MGIIDDQEGIFRRHQREGVNWDLHLSNTKNFITECLEACGANRVAILGSGWLLDIPVNYLQKQVKRVDFYDIRHPRQILKKYSTCKNFRFINMDITGGLLKKTYQLCSGWQKPHKEKLLEGLTIPVVSLPESVDYTVSVNLLNQLDILIIDYINRFLKLDEKQMLVLRKRIQESHLKLLKTGYSCLITDYEEVHLDKDNSITGKQTLVHCTLPAGKYRKSWTWNFDTHRTYDPGHNTLMNVVAIKL
jgi:hypothetical protein